MKKLFLLFILAVSVAFLHAEDRSITIKESDLITIIDTKVREAVKLAVDEAVKIVVISYEKKLIDKQVEITDLTADRDIALEEAKKWKALYEVEQSKSRNKLMTYIIIGASGILFGGALGFSLATGM